MSLPIAGIHLNPKLDQNPTTALKRNRFDTGVGLYATNFLQRDSGKPVTIYSPVREYGCQDFIRCVAP